jgi:D-aspartate ligase
VTRSTPGALVIGANLRALGIARSLGRRGVETWVLRVPGDDQVARASRYVRRTLRAPEGDSTLQRDGLLAIAARHQLDHWALFATDDEPAAAIAQQHEPLATRFAFTSPDWGVFRYAYHKRLTHVLAERIGVAHPWTRYPRTLLEVAELVCPFPAILKPDAKPQENRFTLAKAWRVDDGGSLLAAWRAAARLVGSDGVMVQELIPGGGEAQFSFAALCQQGVALASLVARRTRQYPRDFGRSSSLVETVEAPDVERLGRAVVGALDWHGLIEVEFKRDGRDGSLKLLDINGRVWTWHALGTRAGVDFPYLAWRLSQGLPIEPVRARPGVRWVRLATDVPSAVAAVRAGELSLRGWAASLQRPRQAAVLAFDDPLPSLLDPVSVAWRAQRRRARVNRERTRQSLGPRPRSPRPSSRGRSATREFG